MSAPPPTLTHHLAERFEAIYGVRIGSRDRDRFETEVENAMRARGWTAVAVLEHLDSKAPQILGSLLDGFLVGETYFFRDARQLDMIVDELVPRISKERDPGHLLRIWSVGCSTGEEVYSLAALLAERDLLGSALVRGSDVSQSSLDRANAGVYREWSVRNKASRRILPYLEREGDCWRVKSWLRGRVSFSKVNLLGDDFERWKSTFARQDVVLCRNVFIYFDPQNVARAVRRIYSVMAPGGYLVVSVSDPLLHGMAPFEILSLPSGLVYRKPVGTPHASQSRRRSPWKKTVARKDEGVPRRKYRAPVETVSASVGSPERIEQIRALKDVDPVEACARCEALLEVSPLDLELHHLHTTLLMGAGRYEEALLASRRMVYLDHNEPIGHLMMGLTARCSQNRDVALRSFRNVVNLLVARPGEDTVPYTDGETVDKVLRAARQHVLTLEGEA